jgi:hypothetical protein
VSEVIKSLQGQPQLLLGASGQFFPHFFRAVVEPERFKSSGYILAGIDQSGQLFVLFDEFVEDHGIESGRCAAVVFASAP